MDQSLFIKIRDAIEALEYISQQPIAPTTNKGILDALGKEHGTDKASGSHDYLHFYERFLTSLRDKPIVLLEIGVGGANSLHMWRDFFPLARIVGMDNNSSAEQYRDKRIEILIGDQGNQGDLDRITQTYGPFDVIVDDAGHDPNYQMSCYRHMLPSVKPGGFYILEDIGNHEVSQMLGEIAVDLIHGENNTGLSNKCEFIATYRETSVTRRKELP